MTDTSSRRRMAGRFMVGAAVIALPLTASITYAEGLAPEPPAAPAVPSVAVAPPAPPVAPTPPAAPLSPAALQAITEVDPNTEEEVEVDVDVDIDVDVEDENVFVWREVDESDDGLKKSRVSKVKLVSKGKRISEEEREAIIAELRADLEDARKDMKKFPRKVDLEMFELNAVEGLEKLEGLEGRTVVKMKCDTDSEDVATVKEGEGQIRTIYMCQTRVMAQALKGLKEARKAIAGNTEMDAEMRDQVLEELDRQIENWNDRDG